MAMRASREGKTATRISFDSTSLAPAVFEMAIRRDLDIVLVGGGPGVAELARQAIKSIYPDVRIVAALGGFEHEEKLIVDILSVAPRLVIAGMGAATQESLLLGLVARGWTGVGFTCGGYFDQLIARGLGYYPPWIDRLNLRWAWRLWMEPRRLWRRYLLQYPEFAFQAIGWLLLNGRRSALD
jgi:N-acetylglucosaminyldiphosphoundecaprenol N-acetyl-beta-D-mannosaminyltransferase